MKKVWFIVSLCLVALVSTRLLAKYEQEQLQIETQLQQRIDGILSKTLPANSYLVTVKVEMEDRELPATHQSSTAKRGGSSSLLGQNQYVLPGVPQKKEFVTQPETTTETTVNAFSAETLVKHILISILVAPDVSADQIRGIRDVISGSIPFNPIRGDEMDIKNSSLLKPMNPVATSQTASAGSGGPGGESNPNNGGFLSSLSSLNSAPALILMGALAMAFLLLIAFLFGPVRAFLNRLLAVLPRVGEQAAYTVSNAPVKAAAAGTFGNGYNGGSNGNGNGNGNGSHNPAEDGARPFRFIREDQLAKLPILFKGMPPAQCALVLAYIPAPWASKVLGSLDAAVQNAIMRELSQAHEVSAESVVELEEQVKAKLPYLVGGVDWIQSVYQLTQPQTQRALLGTLNAQSPELAQSLRKKTFFLEDLNVISAGALRMIVQEVGYPTAALALRDERPEIRDALLGRLPVAMREIVQQELDLAADDKTAMADAKSRLMDVGRKLLLEGRMTLPEARNR